MVFGELRDRADELVSFLLFRSLIEVVFVGGAYLKKGLIVHGKLIGFFLGIVGCKIDLTKA